MSSRDTALLISGHQFRCEFCFEKDTGQARYDTTLIMNADWGKPSPNRVIASIIKKT
jgi:hypothetical protein